MLNYGQEKMKSKFDFKSFQTGSGSFDIVNFRSKQQVNQKEIKIEEKQMERDNKKSHPISMETFTIYTYTSCSYLFFFYCIMYLLWIRCKSKSTADFESIKSVYIYFLKTYFCDYKKSTCFFLQKLIYYFKCLEKPQKKLLFSGPGTKMGRGRGKGLTTKQKELFEV